MTRRIAIADVHGEWGRLNNLLYFFNYSTSDRLFLLGDYIDRGENSKSTVELVCQLQSQCAIVLKGNHEHVAASVLRGNRVATKHWPVTEQLGIWLEQGGWTTMRDYGGKIPDDVLDWFDSLPLYHEEPDCILVHAGLRPWIPLEYQAPDDLLWIRQEFIDGYSGKRVIAGHTPTFIVHGKHEVYHGEDKVLIDTGAVFGGVLTAYDIDTGETWTV